MPNTPNRGYPYPAESAAPGLVWNQIEQLAEAVDADMAAQVVAFAALSKGVIARGNRTSDPGGISGETGILRLDDVPVLAGRLYRVSSTQRAYSTVGTDVYGLRHRITTDGTTPTTASTILNNGEFVSHKTGAIWGFYTPGSNLALSVLLTLRLAVGTGTFNANGDANMHLLIEDLGVDPGDTGTDV